MQVEGDGTSSFEEFVSQNVQRKGLLGYTLLDETFIPPRISPSNLRRPSIRCLFTVWQNAFLSLSAAVLSHTSPLLPTNLRIYGAAAVNLLSERVSIY